MHTFLLLRCFHSLCILDTKFSESTRLVCKRKVALPFGIKPLYTVRFHKGQFSGFSFVAPAVPPSVAEEWDQTSGVSS